jgi:hypothetical protein
VDTGERLATSDAFPFCDRIGGCNSAILRSWSADAAIEEGTAQFVFAGFPARKADPASCRATGASRLAESPKTAGDAQQRGAARGRAAFRAAPNGREGLWQRSDESRLTRPRPDRINEAG